MSKPRAKKIKLILFDVDGVLTDGAIWLFPAPAGAQQGNKTAMDAMADKDGFAISSQTMIEAKGFHAHDGIGFTLARLGGLKTGIITKRISETVALRARDLKVDHVYQGQSDKLSTLRKIIQIEKISAEEVAFIGDDIVDLPVMRAVGLAISVPNAREEVKDEAHIITDHDGGQGAGRDAVEYVLHAQGRLQEVVDQYISSTIAKA